LKPNLSVLLTMRIASLNINGIRAGARKGFFTWLNNSKVDVICLQEIKAHEDQLDPEIFRPKGWHVYFNPAQRKGYSGVAIYTRLQPDNIILGLGENFTDFDNEGRYLQIDFNNLSIASIYLPSGSSSAERQNIKYAVMDKLTPRLNSMFEDKRDYILCGDWNIAHKNIDLKNWRSNQKNSGFLPEERAWLDLIFDKQGWVDAFRVLNQQEHQYTWWSNRGQAWANNTGWRIDYHIISPGLIDKLSGADIYKDERFSDHAPLTLDYQIKL